MPAFVTQGNQDAERTAILFEGPLHRDAKDTKEKIRLKRYYQVLLFRASIPIEEEEEETMVGFFHAADPRKSKKQEGHHGQRLSSFPVLFLLSSGLKTKGNLFKSKKVR